MVGHLFGYEAALAIDAQARPLREARAVIEALASGPLGDPTVATSGEWLRRAGAGAEPGDGAVPRRVAAGQLQRPPRGRDRGPAGVAAALRHRAMPLEGYELESGRSGRPRAVIADLLDALTAGIDELTRRSTPSSTRPRPSPSASPAARTRSSPCRWSKRRSAPGRGPEQFGLPGPAHPGRARRVRSRRCSATPGTGSTAPIRSTRERRRDRRHGPRRHRTCASRTAADPRLRGTKHRAADEREVTVARGRSDGRTVILVPEVKDGEVTGMTLLHVRFVDRLPARRARAVLAGYRDRYAPWPTPSPRPSRSSTTSAWRRSRSSTCSPSRSTCWPSAGAATCRDGAPSR